LAPKVDDYSEDEAQPMSERRPAPKSGSEDSLIPASTIAKAASLEELVVAIGGAIQQSEAGDEAPLRLNVAEPWIKRRSLASESRSDSNPDGAADEDAPTLADASGIWAVCACPNHNRGDGVA
jgi:hypothetical protein